MTLRSSRPVFEFEDNHGNYYEVNALPDGEHFRLEREDLGDRYEDWIVRRNPDTEVERWNVRFISYYKLAVG